MNPKLGLVVSLALLMLAAQFAAPVVSAMPSTGTSRWVSISCRFADSIPEPFISTETITDMFGHNRGLEVWFTEISDSKLFIDYTVQPWKTLPQATSAYDLNDGTAVFEACTKLHDPEVDFSRFDAVLMFIDGKGNNNLGGATWKVISLDGKAQSWPFAAMFKTSRVDQGVVGHEMLHAYNLPDGFGQSPDGKEYNANGDYYATFTFHDVMSIPCGLVFSPNTGSLDGAYGCIGGHTRMLYKQKMGWISNANVCTFNPQSGVNQTFRLESSARPVNSENCYMLRVPLTNVGGQYIILEARMKRGFDGPLAKAGVIATRTWGDIYDQYNPHYVTTIGGTRYDSLNQQVPDIDATVYEVGETFTSEEFCFKAKVDQHNASREEQSYSVTISKTC